VGIDINRESPLEADSRTVIMRQSCKEAEAALAVADARGAWRQ